MRMDQPKETRKDTYRYIKKRDNFSCRVCGKRFPLCVHHIDENRKNNKDDNLVTVCYTCHRKHHIKDAVYVDKIFKIIVKTEKRIKPYLRRDKSFDEVLFVFLNSKTFREAGDKLEVTRQRAHQIYKKLVCLKVEAETLSQKLAPLKPLSNKHKGGLDKIAGEG